MEEVPKASLGSILAYSFPVGVVAFLLLPAVMFIPDVYSRFYGLKFSTIATASLAVNLAMTFANPLIGFLVDHHRSKGGSRRSWVIFGLMVFVASSYQLLTPPKQLSEMYYSFWLIAVIVSWLLFDLPHLAWGGELAHNYHERTRLFGIRCLIVSAGSAAFYLVPLCIGAGPSRISPESLRIAAEIGVLMTVPALGCAVRFVPPGKPVNPTAADDIRSSVTVICRNRPFLLLVSICVLLGVGQGMWLALSAVIFDYYFGVGEKLSLMYLTSCLITAAALPLLIKLAKVLGKKYTFAVVQVGFISLIAIPLFLKRGEGAYLPLMVVLVAANIVNIFNNVITNAILTDTIDYGLWKYRSGRSATYFAAFNFLIAVFGCAVGPLGFGLLDRFGFQPHGIVDWEQAKIGVDLTFFAIPASMSALAIVLILRIPICNQRAASIRKRLDARDR